MEEQPLEGEPVLAPAPNDADGMWMAEGQVLMESGGGPDSRCVLHPVCVRPRHYDSECFMYINEKTCKVFCRDIASPVECYDHGVLQVAARS